MPKIILYIATTLDGFISREKGEVDWLEKYSGTGEDYGYTNFYSSIGTTIMGGMTYRQVLTFGEFPYQKTKNFVLTRNPSPPTDEFVEFVNQNPIEFIKNMKSSSESDKDIWLIGGAQIIELFWNSHLIDEIILFIMPETLGSGISLFTSRLNLQILQLVGSKQYNNGVVRLVYSCEKPE